jgi:hypothetical protein
MLNAAIAEHKKVKTWLKSFAVSKDGTNQLEAIDAKAENTSRP